MDEAATPLIDDFPINGASNNGLEFLRGRRASYQHRNGGAFFDGGTGQMFYHGSAANVNAVNGGKSMDAKHFIYYEMSISHVF